MNSGSAGCLPDSAVYRDGRHKLEVTFDPVLLPIGFQPEWNRWKHLLAGKVQIDRALADTRLCRDVADGCFVVSELQHQRGTGVQYSVFSLLAQSLYFLPCDRMTKIVILVKFIPARSQLSPQ